jgi:hypothetical protein
MLHLLLLTNFHLGVNRLVQKTNMPPPDTVYIHRLCRANPTCSLLYGQTQANFTAFGELSNRYSTRAPFNSTLIMQEMSNPEFAIPYYLIAMASEPLCGPFLTWVPDEGCVDSLPNEQSSAAACNVLLGIVIIAAIFVFIGLIVMRIIKLQQDKLNMQKKKEIKEELQKQLKERRQRMQMQISQRTEADLLPAVRATGMQAANLFRLQHGGKNRFVQPAVRQ